MKTTITIIPTTRRIILTTKINNNLRKIISMQRKVKTQQRQAFPLISLRICVTTALSNQKATKARMR